MSKFLPALALALVLWAGCDDPSKNKPQAEVGSAKAVSSAAPAGGATYLLDASSSKLQFVGSKAVGSHDGGFEKISGTATLPGDAIAGGAVTVEIDMASVYSDADGLTKHLKADDFFQVDKHPTAKFESTSIANQGDGYEVTGNLTLRGVTKSITFPAAITKSDDRVKVAAEFSINRKNFGIAYDGKEDNLIRDGVVIKLDLTLTKKTS